MSGLFCLLILRLGLLSVSSEFRGGDEEKWQLLASVSDGLLLNITRYYYHKTRDSSRVQGKAIGEGTSIASRLLVNS